MSDSILIEQPAKAIMLADEPNDEMERWHQSIPQAEAALAVLQSSEIPASGTLIGREPHICGGRTDGYGGYTCVVCGVFKQYIKLGEPS